MDIVRANQRTPYKLYGIKNYVAHGAKQKGEEHIRAKTSRVIKDPQGNEVTRKVAESSHNEIW
jgi:hypothetical protein